MPIDNTSDDTTKNSINNVNIIEEGNIQKNDLSTFKSMNLICKSISLITLNEGSSNVKNLSKFQMTKSKTMHKFSFEIDISNKNPIDNKNSNSAFFQKPCFDDQYSKPFDKSEDEELEDSMLLSALNTFESRINV